MLFTRCPGCQTTFRITPEALHKAGGQVRCGRCAAVFDAYAELRDETGRAVGPDDEAIAASGSPSPGAAAQSGPQPAARSPPGPPPGVAQPPAAPPGAAATHSPEDGVGAPPHGTAEQRPTSEAAPPAAAFTAEPADEEFGSVSVEEVMRQIERGGDGERDSDDGDEVGDANDADDFDDDAHAPAAITPAEVAAVLEGDHTHTLSTPWLPHEPRASRWWTAGAVVAVLALVVQAVHHYRNELALHGVIGAPLRSVYASLGWPLSPRWDLSQYQILDWVAAAEPNASGRGSLKITARIRNRGPRAQPYPQIHLQLEDRWDVSVGSRVFAPEEYLARAPESMMAAGATAQAELEVVDPGPDAYGFELDVCIEMEGALRCSADLPFR